MMQKEKIEEMMLLLKGYESKILSEKIKEGIKLSKKRNEKREETKSKN